MKYTEEQDIQAIVNSIEKGKPQKKALCKRLVKKYKFRSVYLVLKSFEKVKTWGTFK